MTSISLTSSCSSSSQKGTAECDEFADAKGGGLEIRQGEVSGQMTKLFFHSGVLSILASHLWSQESVELKLLPLNPENRCPFR